jgi:CubicO group peptidase (beta-lactamase class C family)
MKARTPETAVAESLGLSTPRCARIEAAMQRRIEAGELAGAISAVSRKGSVAYFRCQGMRDVAAALPMTPDTIFRIYSMSKPVTAVALLTLYEEGHFQLDDPASAFIPELARMKALSRMTEKGPELADMERPITFRHLFTHTSGLCYRNAEGTPAERLLARAFGATHLDEKDMTLEQWMTTLVSSPLAHQPGAAFTYGFSIDVLGRLVEVISGKPFDQFLKERIFEPLQMADTDFFVPEPKHSRLAKVYAPRVGGGFEVVPWSTNAFWKKPLFLSGGGGLVSTAADYFRFAHMLLNEGEPGRGARAGTKNGPPDVAMPCSPDHGPGGREGRPRLRGRVYSRSWRPGPEGRIPGPVRLGRHLRLGRHGHQHILGGLDGGAGRTFPSPDDPGTRRRPSAAQDPGLPGAGLTRLDTRRSLAMMGWR